MCSALTMTTEEREEKPSQSQNDHFEMRDRESESYME